MRSFADAKIRWDATFAHRSSLSDLRTAVKNLSGTSPCVQGLRSICWKAFLLFQNLDQSTWTKTLADSRSAYSSLKVHLLKDPQCLEDLSAGDPLSEDATSPWNKLRQDEALRAEIFQDVERCMQDNFYFREPSTQMILLDILFIYCKLNEDIGYRQGMHEVLAPVLWVLSRDAIDQKGPLSHSQSKSTTEDIIRDCLDSRFLEHDAFTLFGVMMHTVKSFYEMGDLSHAKDPQISILSQVNSPIVHRSNRIHEEYLARADPELMEHLTANDVLPQIYLMRWIRLLFGREFPFDDVLSLWDSLFAEDPALELVDFICVAMLLRIRWQLLEADNSTALTLLLRYPVPSPPSGPSTFVGDALYLRTNIMLDGGVHIISKYSGKAPELRAGPELNTKALGRTSQKQSSRPTSQANSRSVSPWSSPGKLLHKQGGIEGVLQGAAKEVYTRSERLGVNQAIRGAVQGLQSPSSPRKSNDGSRSSLHTATSATVSSAQLTARIRALEKRNQALAKMLETAMKDLWNQQDDVDKEGAHATIDAISVAIAKVQFVQVYLEDSTMPLVPETGGSEPSAAFSTVEKLESSASKEPQPKSHDTGEVLQDDSVTNPKSALDRKGPAPVTVARSEHLSGNVIERV